MILFKNTLASYFVLIGHVLNKVCSLSCSIFTLHALPQPLSDVNPLMFNESLEIGKLVLAPEVANQIAVTMSVDQVKS